MSKLALHVSKNNRKIFIIIGIQISILLSSFLIIEMYQWDNKLLGESIDYAGKNRYLTDRVLLESMDYIGGFGQTQSPYSGLSSLENNIEVLKTGGTVDNNIKLDPLPANLIQDWQSVHDRFIIYKNSVQEILKHNTGTLSNDTEFSNLQEKAINLINASNTLVNKLALHSDTFSQFILNLQIFLMILNFAVHALMILFIIRIIRSESIELKKMDRLAIIGETAARLGHDLRNPLSIIRMNLDLMRLKSNKEGHEQISPHRYEVINKAISRMSHQIEDVLDFVRIKPLNLENHSLAEIINQVNDKITKPNGIKISLPQNDVEITCDAKNLEIAFINLITNAVQAIGEKGEVTVKITDDKYNAYVSIIDSGPGIPSDILPKIFDPLFTTKQIGTGLGLPSCKNIIHQHKGNISVKNNPTTFTVAIPKNNDVSFGISKEQKGEQKKMDENLPVLKERISNIIICKQNQSFSTKSM